MGPDVVDIVLEVELLQPFGGTIRNTTGFGVARVIGSDSSTSSKGAAGLVLAPVSEQSGSSIEIPADRCFALPSDMPLDRAVVVPPLAFALWIWDVAGLELGETAVYSSGSAVDGLVARVAEWRCGGQVIRLDFDNAEYAATSEIVSISGLDPQHAIDRLSQAMSAAPGTVAALMTDRAAAADIILQSIPLWGRVVVASQSTEAATIDFYNNVHRKGCRILSVPGLTEELFDEPWNRLARPHVSRAIRILQNDRLAIQCMT